MVCWFAKKRRDWKIQQKKWFFCFFLLSYQNSSSHLISQRKVASFFQQYNARASIRQLPRGNVCNSVCREVSLKTRLFTAVKYLQEAVCFSQVFLFFTWSTGDQLDNRKGSLFISGQLFKEVDENLATWWLPLKEDVQLNLYIT